MIFNPITSLRVPLPVRLIAVGGGVLFVLFVAHSQFGFGGRPDGDGAAEWLFPATLLTAAAIVAARAVTVRAERLAWVAIAAALLAYAIGFVLYSLIVEHQRPIPYPSVADGFWVAFYPLAFLGLLLLARGDRSRRTRQIGLDAAIGVLTSAALATVLVVEPLLEASTGRASAIVTSVTYPVGALLLLAVVLVAIARTGWRLDRRWAVLAAAFVALVVNDVFYLSAVAAGAYESDGLQDIAYAAISLAIAYAAWRPSRSLETAPADRSWREVALPTVFAAVALGLLVYDEFVDLGELPSLLALAALVSALLRAALAFGELQTVSSTKHLLEQNAAILESAGEGIYGLDADGRTTFQNAAAARMTGRSDDEVIGGPMHDIIHHSREDGSPIARAECPACATLVDGNVRHVTDAVYWRADGTSFPVEFTVSPLRSGGRLNGAVVVFRDVSERREVERLKDEFTSVVSHELRTPLTAIRGSLGLLAGGVLGPLPAKAQRMVEMAVDNSDRLVRLINDMLDIERMASGAVTMQPEACELESLVEQSLEIVGPLAREAGVRLTCDVDRARLWADGDRIVQTLTNLLGNAVKFSPPGAEVAVRGRLRGGEIAVAVEDKGRGIPAEKLDTIFNRFEQVDASDSRAKGGTGLGLAIARSIVEQHGGRIWAASAGEGLGSTFCFCLPAQREQTAREVAGPVPPTVLVCDDDAVVRDVVSQLLEDGGYRVLCEASGEAAIERAAAEAPDAILLDLLMPGLDGWQTAAALTERPETASIPIVIASVLSAEEGGAPLAGAVDWLEKPLEQDSLFGALDRVLGANERRLSHVLIVEDDDGLAEVLAATFQRHGIDTSRATGGADAIRLSRRLLPDLLVLDLMLEQGDGFEVVAALRRHDRLRSVPTIVHTARELSPADRERLRLGETQFVRKGTITPEQFEERVLGLLGELTGIGAAARA